jgi:signal transduction histidine kinase
MAAAPPARTPSPPSGRPSPPPGGDVVQTTVAGPAALGPRSPLVSGVRWSTLAVGLVLAVVRGPVHGRVLAGVGVLVAYAAWRTLAPQRDVASPPSLVLLELALDVVVVVGTGSWDSPFVFCLMTPLIASGFAAGFRDAARAGAVAVVAVGVSSLFGGHPMAAAQATGQWAAELTLVAVLAGHARRMFGEAERRHSLALDRMDRLAEANDLLVSLHHVAQSLPATLNLPEVLGSTASRLRGLVDCDVIAILLRDDASSRWNVAVGEGTRLAGSLTSEDLPGPLLAATQSSVASLVVVLGEGEGVGVDLLSWSGLYAPLRARGRVVGVVALEHHEPGHYGRRDLQLLDGFLETAALAIDNARWFARIRSMGADEERGRIARDMHDRVGQSLASLAFRLDRLTGQARGHPLAGELDELRGEVREVLTDVRATLSDLRTDVSDTRGLGETLDGFLQRVGERSGLQVEYTGEEIRRLPLLQERELWRIGQEAVVNVERHARATTLDVRWRCDGRTAVLVVADDGCGFSVGSDGRRDSYGITGMRERADALGGVLDISSGPAGTTVRCELEIG